MMDKKMNDELYIWCLQQASDRYTGVLTLGHFKKLQDLEFPWEYYEDALEEMGYNWNKNNPEGIRWKDIDNK